jgi:SET domain
VVKNIQSLIVQIAFATAEWDGNFTENIYQDKIHRYDYEIADNLVDALIGLLDKFPDLSLGMQEDIMDFMLQKVLRTAAGANAKTITSLIPDNPRKLKRVKEVGGTFMYRYQDMIKSNKWLHENGFCLDAIRQGPSKIPNAGRGAFATRDIARGETITVSPMVHIADSDLMEMYPILTLKEGQTTKTVYDQKDEEQPMEMQILLNYAFGHPESSLLLVPVGPHVSLINHGGKRTNAYITWAGKKDDIIENGKVYMDYSVEALSTIREVVFNMKIVALTNIKEGDEITLDYGDSWQQAWNKYQAEFKEVLEGTEHPLKTDDLKAMYKDKPFETVATLTENPYPENVHLACFLETEERPDGTLMTHQKHGWDIVQFSDPVDYDDFDGQTFYRVHALDREEAPGHFYNYTVRARISHAADGIEDVHNVPHDACTFVDMPYTSDIHLPWAFRHFIEIKDSHFPINWRDLRLAEE